jgi:hypothetical protein
MGSDTRFIFRGNAVGAAGHIHKPNDLIIPIQGASSLPVIGGYSRSSVGAVRFSEVLSLESARTEATGDLSEQEKAYKTLANSVVKGVNVTGRLTADALQATLTSTHPVAGGEPSIVPTGTQIVNLRLDGYPVIVTLDLDMFTRYGTRESLSRAYANDDAFYKKYGHLFKSPEDGPNKGTKRTIPESGGYIVTTIVTQMKTSHPKAVVKGNTITLNGFGIIYLGELLITGNSRRLTLLRVKLGSPVSAGAQAAAAAQAQAADGEIACAEIECNGGIIF